MLIHLQSAIKLFHIILRPRRSDKSRGKNSARLHVPVGISIIGGR